MAMYAVKCSSGNYAAEADKKWIPRASLNTLRVGLAGAMAIDAGCARAIWKSNLKGFYKIAGVTVLGSRFIKNGKNLVALCKEYEVVQINEDEAVNTENPEEATDSEEKTPETDPEID